MKNLLLSLFVLPILLNAQTTIDQSKLESIKNEEASVQSLEEMLAISSTKILELQDYITNSEEVISKLNKEKIQISESATIAAAHSLSKEKLQSELKKIQELKELAETSYNEGSEKTEIYKQFHDANINAIKSIGNNKINSKLILEKMQKLIIKNRTQLAQMKRKIKELNKNVKNIKTFLDLVPDWEKTFSKSIKYRIKNTTFRWDSSRLLISWSKLKEAFFDLKNISNIILVKLTDYKPSKAKDGQIKNFITILVYITILISILAIIFIRKIRSKDLSINPQNFMLITFINALIRNKWIITIFTYLSFVLLTYYFTFHENVKFIYLAVWWIFAFYNMWQLGRSSINIIIIERHGQLEGLTETHRKDIGQKIKKIYFLAIIIATMLVPGYFYEIKSTLYNLVLYILMLTFLIFLINTLWSMDIDAFVISKSKKIRIIAKGTRFLLLTIMSIALVSFLVEATGFVTLSSTVQKLLLGNMMVIVIAWVIYILLSQTTEIINKQLISSNLITTATRISLRNFLVAIIGFSVFVFAILLIIKTWTLSFIGTSEVYNLSVISIGKYIITIGNIIQILIAYFIYRAIFVLLSYLWDSFFIDYLNVNIKFRANFLTLTKYFLSILFIITAGGILGFTYKNFVIIIGALGVGIGFGLQNIANDFISGIILLFERPIHIGDIISLENGEIGQVTKIGSRSTTVITNNKSSVVIPNSYLISQKLENLTPTENFAAFTLSVGVEYASDVELVKKVLLKVLESHDSLSKKHNPIISLDKFGDSSINFTIKFWSNRALNIMQIKSDLMFAIEKSFKENDIKIPFSQHVIHFADDKVKKDIKKKVKNINDSVKKHN